MKSCIKASLFSVMIIVFTIAPTQRSSAQIIDIIKEAIIKAIQAADIAVQKLQTETIGLQNAQKQLENVLSQSKLTEISGWVDKQRQQYADYFNELWQVKEDITLYRSVKDIIQKQVDMVAEYKRAFSLFQQDDHFTAAEIEQMTNVYSAMMDESVKNIDQILLVINAFTTQMSDGKRLEIINHAAEKIDQNEDDLKRFNNNNMLLSMSRAKDASEIAQLKTYYGL
jgi:hypothetical protein